MDNICIRSYVKTRLLLGLTAIQIHSELCIAYGPEVVSYRTVARWIRRFSDGQDSLEDNPRSGRPLSAVNRNNIDAVRDLVNEDPHISIDYIADILDVSHGSVDTILKQHLGLRKISARWVPHQLTQQQRQQRIDICLENLTKFETGAWRLCDIVTGDESWFYHRKISSKQGSQAWVPVGGSPVTLVRRQLFEKKTMFVVFFMTSGALLVHQVPVGTSINAEYYRDECLKSLLNRLHKKRPASTKNHVKLHHDNARPHVNNIVNNYLQQEKIKIMPHPPYSPDLAPSDFWLFNHLKHSVGTYPDAISLARALSRAVNSIPKEEYQKTFQKWIERMKLCIEHQGDYFEHLM